MRSSTFLLAAAAAVASAETVNMMLMMRLPFTGEQPLRAMSIGGDSAATTYVLGCKAGTDLTDCGLEYPMVVVQGPKTVAYKMVNTDEDESDEGDFSLEQDIYCSLGGTTVADCTYTASGAFFTNTAATAKDGSMPPKSGEIILSGTELAHAFQTVEVVKETGAIMNYGKGRDGKPTSYEGAAKAIQTGAAETGMVTSKATLPSQTGAVSGAKSSMEMVVSSKASAASSGASAAASTVAEGFAAQVTGLGAAAFAAVAGVMAMAAL